MVRCSWGRREDGQDLLEYALVLPMMLVIILAIVEGGVLVMRFNTVANAAREGARAGLLPVTAACDLACRDGQATAAALTLTEGLDQDAIQVSVASSNTSIQVEVSYRSPLMTSPLLTLAGSDGDVNLRSVATMQRE